MYSTAKFSCWVTNCAAAKSHSQVSTLKLVGVSHLFVVPHIRSSAYVRMLCDAFPALANSRPGDIQEATLPALRHLVVVDNTGEFKQFERELEGVRPAVDFREVMVWREDTAERRRVEDITAGLEVDDVINLQFTRCVEYAAFEVTACLLAGTYIVARLEHQRLYLWGRRFLPVIAVD